MEVILLAKIENLGDLGARVKVKPGYARNYLLPYGKAKAATAENIEEFERRKAELEASEAETIAQAEERRQKLDDLSLTVAMKVSEEGTMFGSVGITEIIEAIASACGEQVQRSEVSLPDGSFRELGEHEVSLKLHPSVFATIHLNIVAEE